MALIECRNCHNTISDKAPQCPHCGYKNGILGKEELQAKNSYRNPFTNNNNIIWGSIGISLIALGFILYRIALKSWYWHFIYSDPYFQFGTLSLIIGVIFIIITGIKIPRRFLFLKWVSFIIGGLTILATILTISNMGGVTSFEELFSEYDNIYSDGQNSYDNLSNYDNSIEQGTGIDEVSQTSGPFGTYEIIDVNGKKWTLLLNNDESAVMESGGKKYYGNWREWDSEAGSPLSVQFPNEDYPEIQFPKTDYLYGASLFIDTKEGFVYGDSPNSSTYKSKNPNKRVSINKVK